MDNYWELYPAEDLENFLLNLELINLFKTCKTQQRVRDICNSDDFWKKRYKLYYSDPGLFDSSWKDHYILTLVTKQCKYCNDDDLRIIYNEVTSEYTRTQIEEHCRTCQPGLRPD